MDQTRKLELDGKIWSVYLKRSARTDTLTDEELRAESFPVNQTLL